jgi:hypothetical protein
MVGVAAFSLAACEREREPEDPSQYQYQPYAQGTTSPPSPAAIMCGSDFGCGTHKCNLQVGKCAWPCQNAMTDCAAGMSCVGGLCVPGLPVPGVMPAPQPPPPPPQ